jgi:hypothetical protein
VFLGQLPILGQTSTTKPRIVPIARLIGEAFALCAAALGFALHGRMSRADKAQNEVLHRICAAEGLPIL